MPSSPGCAPFRRSIESIFFEPVANRSIASFWLSADRFRSFPLSRHAKRGLAMSQRPEAILPIVRYVFVGFNGLEEQSNEEVALGANGLIE